MKKGHSFKSDLVMRWSKARWFLLTI